MSAVTHPVVDDRERVGLVGALAIVPAVVAATIVVTMKVALILGAGFLPAAALSGVSVVLLGLLSFGRNVRCLLPRRPSAIEAMVLVSLLVIIVVLWDRVADRSLVWPHLFGVDQAHHGSLVTWLVDERRLPASDVRLSGLSNYPIGVHLLAALTTVASGRTPLTGMWWTALAIIVSQVFALSWLTRLCSPRRSWMGAPVAIAVWLAAWQFGLGAISSSFFISQFLSVTFCLVGIGLVAHGGAGMPTRRWLPATIILATATGLTYPQHALVIPVCCAFVVALQGRRWFGRASTNQRRVALVGLASAGVVAGLVVWRASQTSPLLTKQAFFGSGEGALPTMTVANLGGAIVVALMTLGVLELTTGARRRREPLVLLVALASVAALTGLLALGRALGWGVTQYRITKNAYLAVPLLAVVAGVGVSSAVQTVFRRRAPTKEASPDSSGRNRPGRLGTTALTAVLLIVAVSRPAMHLSDEPVVDPDSYRLARLAARTIDPETIGIAGEGLSPYLVWWMGLRRIAPTGTAIVAPRMEIWREWPQGDRPERYLIVDATVAQDYASRAGVRRVARFGTATLLERTP